MSLGKQYKLAEKAAIQQRQVVAELEALVKSIDRCEKTVTELKAELQAVQNKYQTRKTTQEEIAYLTDLLKCEIDGSLRHIPLTDQIEGNAPRIKLLNFRPIVRVKCRQECR